MNMHDQIRNFIVKTFLFGDDGVLTDTIPILETGIVDSTGLLEIIQFLETTYGITIEDDELRPANLNSIENIVCFIMGKKKKSSAAIPAFII
jgi:acyl carrier protein